MSSSDELVALHVKAADPATEIFLIDENFALAGRGVGEKTFTVAAGPYKVKARLGTAIEERLLVVRQGMAPVEIPHLEFASPVPIEGTAWTHEYHIGAAGDAAMRPPDVGQPTGTSIIIVAREWTAKEKSPEAPSTRPDPSRGLSLLTFGNEVVADVEKNAKKDLGWDPVATSHIAVAPGAYRLALDRRDGQRIEQTIVAPAGWQTHVYVLMDREGNADLGNAAITMRRPDLHFSDDDLRLEELARQALIEDRTALCDVVRPRISGSALPMLALYGALLLIREAQQAHEAHKENPEVPEKDNKQDVAAAVANLRMLIGEHPDVEAIAIGAGYGNPAYGFPVPPMLRASWLLLLRASSQLADVIAPDSFAMNIADRVWGDGPWLLWTDPMQAEEIGRREIWKMRVAQLLSEWETPVAEIIEVEAAEPSMWEKLKSKITGPVSTPFPDLRAAARKAAQRAVVDATRARALLSDPDLRKKLVREVGLPMSSIREWIEKS